ncbi:hypothetical protein IC608_11325 [Devosia sp. PTR5]|uniref:Uncharacterized protein n=1 Tax=Devosia oryzisoli TaxID=2774138 RepID=A0A927ITQ6_9HYPH|nr:hypothetical protein [Devosia oryzisoli]MBD8066063.1 hypothetical protein [Devosia oryzisoli]
MAQHRQGPRTHEQQQAILQKRVETKGAPVDPHEESITEAREHTTPPRKMYDNSTGDRSIKRGAHQEGEHHKRRVDEDQIDH